MTQDSKIRDAVQKLIVAAGERALSATADKVGAATERLTHYTQNGGGPGLLSAVTGRLSEGPLAEVLPDGGGGGKGKMLKAAMAGGKELLKGSGGGGGGGKSAAKVTNIVERLDVGVPVSVAYNQWTQFTDFPKFMKKVESVEQEAQEKLKWRAQVFWSHRNWESTIVEQVPDRRIVWRSKGAKGYVDGAVTFHEIAPELTRIVMVLEYHPQGFFEHTGNIWRAQGRRARLELKHFGRHVMTQSVLHPDEIEGWRGRIHDGQVVEGEDGDQPDTDDEQARAEGGPTAEGDADEGEDGDDENGDEENGDEEDEEDEEDRDDERQDGEGADAADEGESAPARSSSRRTPRRRLSRSGES